MECGEPSPLFVLIKQSGEGSPNSIRCRAPGNLRRVDVSLRQSHRDRRGDWRVSLIIDDLEIIKLVIEDGLRFAFYDQLRQRERLAAKLQPRLFHVVQVDVAIPSGTDEFAGVKTALLSGHVSQQRVGSDIERDAEKYVRRPLVDLAGELIPRHIELSNNVTWREGHSIQFADVPGADDQATGIGIRSDLFDDAADLVNPAAISGPPGPPLRPVDGAKIAVLVSPFVPDGHAVVGQIFDVRLAT